LTALCMWKKDSFGIILTKNGISNGNLEVPYFHTIDQGTS
jgi:hypothetical protein